MLRDRSSIQNISYCARSDLGRIDIGLIRSNKGRQQRARSYCIARFEFLFLCFGLLLMNNCNYLLKIAFPCRGENCRKLFSMKPNRSKHEKLKNHGPQLEEKTKIPCVDSLYRCPANDCDVESKYKHNTETFKGVCRIEKEKKHCCK